MFVKNANNPKNAAAVAVSPLIPHMAEIKLKELGVDVIKGYSPQENFSAVSLHIDTNLVHIKENVFVASAVSYEYYKKVFKNTDAEILQGSACGVGIYPSDAAYNAAIIGDFAVICEKYADKILLDALYKEGFEFINVKQGYAKCSVCVIDKNSLITDDTAIYKACKKKGLDVLPVEKGDVRLDGFEYGFIGGCSGKIKKDVLAFCGNIELHKNADDIKSFCTARGVSVLSLGDFPLFDVGSILPVFER